jgi:hypothetical protein
MASIRIWEKRTLPNWWVLDPCRDPRFLGLNQIKATIRDAGDLAWGSIFYDREHPDPTQPPIYSPLELASMLRIAVARIEAMTEPDEA